MVSRGLRLVDLRGILFGERVQIPPESGILESASGALVKSVELSVGRPLLLEGGFQL